MLSRGLFAYNHSVVNVSGGSGSNLYALYATDSAVVNFSGGSGGYSLSAAGGSVVRVTGGQTVVYAAGNSVVTISGGEVTGLNVSDASAVTINGGSVDNLTATSGGTININGSGFIGEILTQLGGVVNLAGGRATKTYIYPGGILNIFGKGLTATLAQTYQGIQVYAVSGKYADGSDAAQNVVLYPTNGAKFTLNSVSSASGVLSFEGIVSSASAQNVTFLFRPLDGSRDITQTVSVPPSGAFTLSGLPQKQYTLHIKADKYLAANVSVDATQGNVSGVKATLLAGDANNDNSCDTSDFGVLVGSYGSAANVSGSGYDPTADFNGDGSVDATDFSLLVGNYGQIGAP